MKTGGQSFWYEAVYARNRFSNGHFGLNEFLLRKAGKTWDDAIEPNADWGDIDEKAIVAFNPDHALELRKEGLIQIYIFNVALKHFI